METRLQTTMNGKGSIRVDERTQLDYDIEEARYEMMKGAGMKERKARLESRKAYKIRLAYQIKMALKD